MEIKKGLRMTDRRKLVVLDFDGVLHSYTSGWQGARNIPDPAVDGALGALLPWNKRDTV